MDHKAQNSAQQASTGKSFQFEMPVRWGDLDALNHVNNTVYFRYMEEARVNCMLACGIYGQETSRDIVLASVTCDFLKPIVWPAALLVETRLVRMGRSSLEFEVEIHVKGEEGACARSRNVIVGIDTATGRSSPWTPVELEGVNKVFQAAVE